MVLPREIEGTTFHEHNDQAAHDDSEDRCHFFRLSMAGRLTAAIYILQATDLETKRKAIPRSICML